MINLVVDPDLAVTAYFLEFQRHGVEPAIRLNHVYPEDNCNRADLSLAFKMQEYDRQRFKSAGSQALKIWPRARKRVTSTDW